MSRDYTALPHEYLEELDCLSDAEYGRLVRALQEYSITGNEPQLSGREKDHWKRVRNREERYKTSYLTCAENGKKGGRPKNQTKPNETQKNQTKPNESTKTETETKTKTKTKTKTDNEGTPPTPPRGAPPAKSRFVPPSVDEVRAYCRERGNRVDPERFVDFYTAKGWKVGRDPMKDWKAAVRTWEKRDEAERPKTSLPDYDSMEDLPC